MDLGLNLDPGHALFVKMVLTEEEFSNYFFMLKLDETFRCFEISLLTVTNWRLRAKDFCLQFLVDILPLGSGSVDQHIFANSNPDPGSQKIADRKDPDPGSLIRPVIIWIQIHQLKKFSNMWFKTTALALKSFV